MKKTKNFACRFCPEFDCTQLRLVNKQTNKQTKKDTESVTIIKQVKMIVTTTTSCNISHIWTKT